MSIFIDTSAFLAILDADDQYHQKADTAWQEILSSREDLITTNYILVETFALVQRRLGLEALKVFQGDIIPVLDIEWITEGLHQNAVDMLIIAAQRQLSLVDCTSFTVMRKTGLKKAFTFDSHFMKQGFVAIP
jgi:predicted nucleic acid-binding protein